MTPARPDNALEACGDDEFDTLPERHTLSKNQQSAPCHECNQDAKMQLPAKHLIAVSALLASAPTLSTVDAAVIQPAWRKADSHNDGTVFPFLRWLRDSAVETFLGRPSSKGRDKDLRSDPETVQSRYRDDVVIRFNVTNSEEEAALSKAAAQLLLDVWSFTPDYVDIRLHKEDVAPLRTLLPASLEPSFLVSDLAAAVWATYPSKTTPEQKFDTSASDPAKLSLAMDDGVGGVFFSQYQRLNVSPPEWASRLAID